MQHLDNICKQGTEEGDRDRDRSREWPNSLNKNLHEPADKFVSLVQSKLTSLCYILQNKFVNLVPSQPTNLLAGL
jgi:hypothetical protein